MESSSSLDKFLIVWNRPTNKVRVGFVFVQFLFLFWTGGIIQGNIQGFQIFTQNVSCLSEPSAVCKNVQLCVGYQLHALSKTSGRIWKKEQAQQAQHTQGTHVFAGFILPYVVSQVFSISFKYQPKACSCRCAGYERSGYGNTRQKHRKNSVSFSSNLFLWFSWKFTFCSKHYYWCEHTKKTKTKDKRRQTKVTILVCMGALGNKV